jgi:hypothetical protein
MEIIKAVLNIKGLTINGTTIDEAPTLQLIQTAIGGCAYREVEHLNQGKPWRKFVIFDDLGVRFLYDFEIDRVLDVEFAFTVEKTVSSPKSVFQGILIVNGARLVANMAERLLPIEGEFRFEKRGGWKIASEILFVNMRLSRKRLQAVSVSFVRRQRFKCEQKEP